MAVVLGPVPALLSLLPETPEALDALDALDKVEAVDDLPIDARLLEPGGFKDGRDIEALLEEDGLKTLNPLEVLGSFEEDGFEILFEIIFDEESCFFIALGLDVI